MESKKFKLIYDKKPQDGKLNGSITGIPSETDQEIEIKNISEKTKLVYEDTKLVGGKVVKKAVPNSGYVSRIYFNTKMPADEVEQKLKKITGNDYLDMVNKLYNADEQKQIEDLCDTPEKADIIVELLVTVACSQIALTQNMFTNNKITHINISGASGGLLLKSAAHNSYFFSLADNLTAAHWSTDFFGEDLSKNYITVDDTWSTKADTETLFATLIPDFKIPDNLWKPGFFNEQLKDICYIQEGEGGDQKEIKILKASEKEIPTKDDKEVCELDKLLGE